jgi:SAM-dependent methyltransferase
MPAPILTAIEHYENFLADYYTWMSGPYADKVRHQHDLLTRARIVPAATREAVDLGCGPGSQSIALAELGFSVTAIDANAQLLAELRQHAQDLPIRPVLHDLCALATCSMLPSRVDAAICVGDIIPHLPSRDCVTRLFQQVSAMLVPGGKFMLGFRDLSETLQGLDRFIPIRSDNERIMTCVLEYEPETVIVNDLMYVRQGDRWELHKSSYRKLRLSLDWVCTQLEAHGLMISHKEQTAGVWTVLASKA